MMRSSSTVIEYLVPDLPSTCLLHGQLYIELFFDLFLIFILALNMHAYQILVITLIA